MSRVCGLFLFGIGIGLFLALIFPKSLFMVIMAVLCLLAGYNLFCSIVVQLSRQKSKVFIMN